MKNKNNKKYVYSLAALAAIATLATAVPALADNNASETAPNGAAWGARMGGGMMRGRIKSGVFGTVSAINGNIITVSGKQGFGANATTTTFTVDASSAKIMKAGATGTIASIVVGDTIMAQGTLTGTNLVATMIRDGVPQKGMHDSNKENEGKKPGQTPPVSPITGNGMPIVAGTVSAISGSTLTITNKSNVTYTIDATNAKIVRGQNTITVSGVAVGDMVVVQGTVSGNSIVATSVIDQAKPISTATGTTPPQHEGFFGGIGSFFSRIFGF